MACLVWIAIAAAIAPFHFRHAGVLLALCPATLAVMRLLPGSAGALWANRSRVADVITMGGAAVALAALSVAVPGV